MTRLSAKEIGIVTEALGHEIVRREKHAENLSGKPPTPERDNATEHNKEMQEACEALLDKIGNHDIVIDDDED